MNSGPPKVVNLADWSPPVRFRRNPDGTVVREKLPTAYFLTGNRTIKAVDRAGNVVVIPLFNGMSQNEPDNPYMMRLKFEKLHQQGFIPVDHCPANESWEVRKSLPDAVKNRPPCSAASNGKPISREHYCGCIDELVRIRRAEQATKMESIEAAWQTEAKKAQAALQEQNRQQAETNARLTDLVESLVSNKRGKKASDE